MCCCVTPCGTKIISGSFDKTLIIWNIQDGSVVAKLVTGHSKLVCVDLCCDLLLIVNEGEWLLCDTRWVHTHFLFC